MIKLKTFLCKIACKDGKMRLARISSNHINGAVRKLYQMYDVESLIAIVPE